MSYFKSYYIIVTLGIIMHVVMGDESQKTFNLSSELTCKISDDEIQRLLLTHSVIQTTAMQWATTHKISDWHQTEWRDVVFGEDNSDMIKYNIPFSDGLKHARYDYTSYIHFPKILDSLIEVDVKLPVQKHVYLSNNVIYTITHMANIPVIGYCVIFSRVKFMDSGVALSHNVVMYEELPWYAQIFKSAIEAKLEESLILYHKLFSNNLCVKERQF